MTTLRELLEGKTYSLRNGMNEDFLRIFEGKQVENATFGGRNVYSVPLPDSMAEDLDPYKPLIKIEQLEDGSYIVGFLA